MFWKDAPRLRSLTPASRLAIDDSMWVKFDSGVLFGPIQKTFAADNLKLDNYENVEPVLKANTA